MVKPKASLRGAGCRKKGCRTPTGILHRHHRRHQAMWLGIWSGRRAREPRFRQFVEKYWRFDEEDIEYICDRHHAEIHAVYDQIIQQDRKRLKKPLAKYTWREAERLMDKLERAFWRWLKTETVGMTNEGLRARRWYKKRTKRS